LGADTIFVQVVIKRNYENLQKKKATKKTQRTNKILIIDHVVVILCFLFSF